MSSGTISMVSSFSIAVKEALFGVLWFLPCAIKIITLV